MKRSLRWFRLPLARLFLVVAAVLAASVTTRLSPGWEADLSPAPRSAGLTADVRVPGTIAPLPAAPVALEVGSFRGLFNGPSLEVAGDHGGDRTAGPGSHASTAASAASLQAGGPPARLRTHLLSGYQANAPPVKG